MPRTRSLAWAELKIGIIAVGGARAGGDDHRRGRRRRRFFLAALRAQDQVPRRQGPEERRRRPRRRRRGRQGYATSQLSGAEVEVLLEVKKGNEQRITTNSRASIGSLSLLGEPVIDISPSTTGTPLKDGDYIPAGRAPGQLSDVADTAREGLEQVTAILKDISAGKGTVGKLFTDDAALQGDHRVSSPPPRA